MRAEEALEVGALEDLALVPAAVEEVGGDAALGEAPREEDEGREADPARHEGDAVGLPEVVDRERHAERAEDRDRRPLGEAPERLGADPRLPLSAAEVEALVGDPITFVGDAGRQVGVFADRVAEVAARHPEAAKYEPEFVI